MRRSGEGRDSPIALAVAAKLFRMNMEQQIPGARGLPVDFLNGPEGVPVAKEHGELGILQSFVPGESGILMGGGHPRGHNTSKEPNSVGLSDLSEQLLGSEQLRTGTRY